MKWNNRLKSVLTKNEKSDFSEDCLEMGLRITAESHKSDVSAIIRSDEFRHLPKKSAIQGETEEQQNLVFAVIRSSQLRDSFKKTGELAEIKTAYFQAELNRFIEAGITFDVSADDFLFIDTPQTLKISDIEFLKLNSEAILCQLQQSLLMKHLFSHSPERFEDFSFEVMERESLLSITAKTLFETYFEAVKATTRKWFAELLK
jgi:hypothetical protein